MIAVCSFSAILWTYFHHRRHLTTVEEADFEFYRMSIQGLSYKQRDPVTMKVVAHKAKLVWGFLRARACRKIKNVLWHPAPPCDENELQDVTDRLLTGVKPYGSTGTMIVNS